MLTIVDNKIGSMVPDEDLLVVAFLSEQGRNEVAQLQQHIKESFGADIWCMPLNQLHITLCEIIQAKDYTLDKTKLYGDNIDHYTEALRKHLSTPAYELTFDIIVVSPQAITIQCSSSDLLNPLRGVLVDALPVPPETKRPPDVIHCTIARFASSLDLDKVEAELSRLSICFKETIGEFSLLRNTAPHLASYKIQEAYQLG